MNKHIKLTALAFAASLAFAATSAHATNGVLEINQACAAGPGCFAGDDPGFPVTITNSGSYRLTSNLVNDGDESTITTSGALFSSDPVTNNVTIDLNGFSVLGSCTNTTCADNSDAGISLGIGRGLVVKNGTVAYNDGAGIVVGLGHARIENVTVSSNGGIGIHHIGFGVITNVQVDNNKKQGINTVSATWNEVLVKDSVIQGNDGVGQVGGICSANLYASNGTDNTVVQQEQCAGSIISSECKNGPNSTVTCS